MGYADSLPLPARNSSNEAIPNNSVLAFGKAQLCDDGVGQGDLLLLGEGGGQAEKGAEDESFPDGEVGVEDVVLSDETGLSLHRLSKFATIGENSSGERVGLDSSGKGVEKCRFAAAGGTKDSQDFTG